MASADWSTLRGPQISGLKNDNLSAVTSATDGESVETRVANKLSVFVEVTSNTGAVTVNIEASPTGDFTGEEVTLDSKTYTATNGTDVFSYNSAFPFMRTTTTTQSTSTVSTIITGRS